MDFHKIHNYLMMPFAMIESKSSILKACGAVMLAIPSSWIATFTLGVLHERVFTDPQFMASLIILVIIDLFTGIWKHLILKDFDWNHMFIGLMRKTAISMIGMIVFNILGNVRELDTSLTIRSYFLIVGKFANIFYVGGSAFNNMFIITGGNFPPIGWMKLQKRFNETVSLDAFKMEKEKEQENDKVD